MRLNRPQDAATESAQTAGVLRRRIGAGAIRVLSVTAVAAATCSLWVGAASAATAHATKHATTTTVSVSPKTAFVDEVVKLSARVSGGKTPTGKVTFKINGTKICTRRLSAGKASCRVIVEGAGTFNVRAFYAGNATHKASSSGIAKLKEIRAKTTTKITNSPNPGAVDVGASFTFHVTVTSQAGAPAANGSVKVAPTAPKDLPAAYSCTAKVTNGKGSCSITPPAYGIDDYAATFAGNRADKSSTYAGPFALAVQNVTTTSITATSTTVGDVTLTTDVFADGANITGTNGGIGSVTVYIGTTAANVAPIAACAGQLLTTFTGAPGNDNVYTCTGVTALNSLPAGTYYISAVFSGDPVNVGSNSNPPTKITIG
jgi:hypothetical protein